MKFRSKFFLSFFFIDGYHLRQDYISSKTHTSFLSLITSFSPDETINRTKAMLLKQQISEVKGINVSNDDDHQTSIFSLSDTFPCEPLTNKVKDLVQFNTKLKAFTVRSPDQQVVHMNDRECLFRCSCSSTMQNCAHLLAVKDYLGFV
jgi:hypothetical protein